MKLMMTKEELTEEAREQVNYCTPYHPESFVQGYIASAESREGQLTKAKELLKRCYDNHIYLEPLRSEIAQFLSEVE